MYHDVNYTQAYRMVTIAMFRKYRQCVVVHWAWSEGRNVVNICAITLNLSTSTIYKGDIGNHLSIAYLSLSNTQSWVLSINKLKKYQVYNEIRVNPSIAAIFVHLSNDQRRRAPTIHVSIAMETFDWGEINQHNPLLIHRRLWIRNVSISNWLLDDDDRIWRVCLEMKMFWQQNLLATRPVSWNMLAIIIRIIGSRSDCGLRSGRKRWICF